MKNPFPTEVRAVADGGLSTRWHLEWDKAPDWPYPVDHLTEKKALFAAHAINQHDKLKQEIDGFLEFQADVHRIAREMDVVMHGEEGAAKQPSLCDLQTPLQRLKDRHDRMKELLQLAYDVIDDDLEERPARHSLGNLAARIRALLAEEDCE